MGGLRRLGGKTKRAGNQPSQSVSDEKTQLLLDSILVELRLMNIYLYKMTDIDIDKNDIEV